MSLKFVSAGYSLNTACNMGIYIKYGNYNTFKLVSDSTYHTHLITPDREIYMQGDIFRNHINPLLNDFDEYIDLNALGKNYSKDCINQYMVNFIDADKYDINLKKNKEKGSLIFCDSGGFQVAVGRADVINPIKLAQFYNSSINLGMVLDIPPYSADKLPDYLVDDLAKNQKRNNSYMLKYINKDVELINILHGTTLQQKINYLKIVHNPKINRLAISSVGIPMSLPRLNLFLEVLRVAKELGYYKHLHILGSFNKSVIYTLAKLAHSTLPEVQGIEFTMDASTPLQESLVFKYYKNLNIWEGLDEFTPLPKERLVKYSYTKSLYNKGFGKFNQYSELPCNCPICSKLKYSYVLRNIRGGVKKDILQIHNSIEANNYINMVDSLATNLSNKEYLQYIKRVQDNDTNQTIQCLKFIYYAEKHGLEKARKDYGKYLDENTSISKTGLLNSDKPNKKLEDYLKGILDRYNSIDFENYKEEIKVKKAFRSSTSMGDVKN